MNIINLPFWVVLYPTRESTFADVCFKSSWREMERQFRGGLTEEQIAGIYNDESEALREAGYLLNENT